jgi:hypothetical protein
MYIKCCFVNEIETEIVSEKQNRETHRWSYKEIVIQRERERDREIKR